MGNAGKALALLVLTGCARDLPQQSSGVKPFPSPPSQEYALLFVYMDRHDDLKSYPTLRIDGESVVKLPKDSYTWCYVKPGARMVRLLWGDQQPGLNHHQNIEFKGGESLFVRYRTKGLNFLPGGAVFGEANPVYPEVARTQIGNSTYRPAKKAYY